MTPEEVRRDGLLIEPTDNRYTVSLTTGPCPIWDVEILMDEIRVLTRGSVVDVGAIRADIFEGEPV